MKYRFPIANLRLKPKQKKQLLHVSKTIFWFFTGALLALVFISSFGLYAYKQYYSQKIYLGIYVNNIDFGGKTKAAVQDYFAYKNSLIENSNFTLTSNYGVATVSAKEINFGFDKNLSGEQAYSIGRSGNFISDLSIILQAYLTGINLPPAYTLDQEKLYSKIKPISEIINKQPVNALFKFENNRVTVFKPSSDGQIVDSETLNQKLLSQALNVVLAKTKQTTIQIPIKILKPEITTEKANNLGIKELIGVGHSLFYHSIPGRIYNVNLAATRLNGILVAPDEIFSFDKTLGDVSAFTGYQQAYVIQNGKTVLGDGGGVCQVSTTFFRALLNAGLPIVERHAHAYRVGYYEEDSPPGIDATVFVPSVDLKFKNDTEHYILIQSIVDLDNLALSFYLYGTSDGRKVTMTTPVVTNQTPPPPTLYQDDPSLPKGEIKQTDFAAWGANVYFTRTVTKNNKILISDKFVSNYRPWQAVYLVGTRE
jgi:vancomycin resistance protein YoaR